jgi:phage terminase large subunit-like protein
MSNWMPAFYTPEEEGYSYEEGDKAIAIAEFAFANNAVPMKLDEFQKWILRQALQTDKDGNFRFRQYIVSMGRQNGKTTIASALMLYFMLAHSPQPNVFAIASTLQQANIAYSRFSNLVNSSPEIKKKFRQTTETRGIKTKAGGYLQVSTSKAASLQGHSLTACVLDELHILKPETYDAVVIGAGQQHNSLIFGITTAGSEESELLKRLYEQGKSGAPGLGIAIWEAPEGSKTDDPEALKAANPALAEGRMSLEDTLQEVAVLPEADAVRYKLNRFITAENPFLPFGKWKQLGECSYPPEPMKICADISPGWGAFTLTGAWRKDKEVHTCVLASVIKPSYEQALSLLLKVLEQVPYTEVGISTYWGKALLDALNEKGVRTKALVRRDEFVAPPLFYEAVMRDEVKHQHLDLLDYQMARVGRKEQGDEYKLVRPSGAVEIDVAMSCVFAVYLALIEQSSPVQVF